MTLPVRVPISPGDVVTNCPTVVALVVALIREPHWNEDRVASVELIGSHVIRSTPTKITAESNARWENWRVAPQP